MEQNNSTASCGMAFPTTVTVIVSVLGTMICLIYLWLIFSIILSRRLRNQSNFFLASLFATELFSILLLVTEINLDSNFRFPKTPVLFFDSILGALAHSYLLFSAVVAADRYFKIAKPMQYMRLMSNKVCACIILAVWGLLAVVFIGSFVANLSYFDADLVSICDLFLDKTFLHQSVILLDIFTIASLLPIAAFVVALASIARKHQRRIAAERINLGHISTAHQPADTNEDVSPRRPHSHKLVWYLCTYFATVVIAWVPNTVLITLVTFERISLTQAEYIVMYVLDGIAILQMVFGALFLAYMQREHRLLLNNACQAILNKFTR